MKLEGQRRSENFEDARSLGDALLYPFLDSMDLFKRAYEDPFRSPFAMEHMSPSAGSPLSMEGGYGDIEGMATRPDFIADVVQTHLNRLDPQFETMEQLLEHMGFPPRSRMDERARRNFPAPEPRK